MFVLAHLERKREDQVDADCELVQLRGGPLIGHLNWEADENNSKEPDLASHSPHSDFYFKPKAASIICAVLGRSG